MTLIITITIIIIIIIIFWCQILSWMWMTTNDPSIPPMLFFNDIHQNLNSQIILGFDNLCDKGSGNHVANPS